ncbi:unnamed protein product [Gemmata massiliana]|uniref:HTH hxlR-type domain-containing protein n=1 Tax=Gemmata massiliana TaxID=1210884 RepID=A0A6P2CXF7_9BACT|nr:hypothetical protein [Gemmata massiliana]VTR92835.1 unnamed protein product [Gemmata massiliana]
MLLPISHATWQQLRVLSRAKGKPVLGSVIRYSPTRFTKTGEFLDELVSEGLIERAERKPVAGSEPEQFRAKYTLTEKGKHAAEYGEYERARTPQTAG